MNIAYTESYAAWRERCDIYFSPQFLTEQPEEITPLADGFSIRSISYAGAKDGYPCTVSENELLNSDREVVYTWRNLESGSGFIALFHHANGQHYLIFRTELYGYSVLEIESGRDFHYIPSQAHPQRAEDFDETFIWCDASYHSKNNLLAVDGCFWACPYSVLLVDFTDPLREQPAETWIDIHTELDPDYERYGHLDFDHWDENGDLYLKIDEKDDLCVSAEQIKNWLRR